MVREPIQTQGVDLSQLEVQKSGLVQKLDPNQRINVHILFPSKECLGKISGHVQDL